MQGVLEIYDTLRSECIPAACYAVGKMEANQQGSAFSVTALWICRGRALPFSQTQPLFKLMSACMHRHKMSAPLR